MRINNQIRNGEASFGGGCGGAALLIIGGIALFAICNSQEGKKLGQDVISKTQPPVQVSLTRYLIFKGYYVNVTNTSTSTTVNGVVVTYTGTSGNSKAQILGTLRPGETKTLSPSDVQWRVEKHESISVSADGYITKTLNTNTLIDR
jgi:hypothetical protein